MRLSDIHGISIHAPREGGDVIEDNYNPVLPISIHAPREGGDDCIREFGLYRWDISIEKSRYGISTAARDCPAI